MNACLLSFSASRRINALVCVPRNMHAHPTSVWGRLGTHVMHVWACGWVWSPRGLVCVDMCWHAYKHSRLAKQSMQTRSDARVLKSKACIGVPPSRHESSAV